MPMTVRGCSVSTMPHGRVEHISREGGDRRDGGLERIAAEQVARRDAEELARLPALEVVGTSTRRPGVARRGPRAPRRAVGSTSDERRERSARAADGDHGVPEARVLLETVGEARLGAVDPLDRRPHQRPDRPTARSRRRACHATPRRAGKGSVRRSAIGASVASRYADLMARMRVALPSSTLVVGDLDGNVDAHPRRARRRPRRTGADLVVFPELGDHRVSARGPRAEARIRRRQPRRARQGRRPHRTMRRGRGVRRRRPRPPQRRGGVRERRGRSASIASVCCPTTRCSTSSATSYRETSRSSSTSIAGISGGRVDLRGRVEPDRADRRHRRPVAPRSSSTSTPHRTTPARSRRRERMLATRAADASCAIVYVNQVGGQDELVFDGASLVFDADGVADHPGAAVRRRGVRHRRRASTRVPQAHARSPRLAEGHALPKVALSQDPSLATRCAADRAGARPARPRSTTALVLRHARLRPQERVHRRRDRSVGRHRLVARRVHRRRRARPRTRARRVHALALFE